jgi:uncharacterized membrane protein (DUF373 family)
MAKLHEKILTKIMIASLYLLILAACCGIIKISYIVFRWCLYGFWG